MGKKTVIALAVFGLIVLGVSVHEMCQASPHKSDRDMILFFYACGILGIALFFYLLPRGRNPTEEDLRRSGFSEEQIQRWKDGHPHPITGCDDKKK